MPMRSKFKYAYFVLFFFVILPLASIYFIYNHNYYIEIKNISYANISIIYILNIFTLIINGIVMNITISSLGVNLRFIEYTSISVLSTFGNIFLPFQSGIGFRAIYLKSRYNLGYTLFFSTLAGNYIIIFNVISIIGLIGILILYFTDIYFRMPIFFILVLSFIGSTYPMFHYPKDLSFIPFIWIKNRIENIIEGWLIIKKSFYNIIYLYTLTLFNLIISIFITYIEFKLLNISDMSGTSITLLQALFISIVNTLSMFINITPASLGTREALVMLTSRVVNISPANALSVIILDRIFSFSLILVLSYPASWFLKDKKT